MMFLYWATDLEREGISHWQLVVTNLEALAMDISSMSYTMLIPVLLLITHMWTGKQWSATMFRVSVIGIFLLTCLINTSDIGLFQQWGTRLDKKALSYLAFPKQAAAAVSGTPVFLLILLFLGMSIPGIVLFRRTFKELRVDQPVGHKIASSIGLLALTVIGIRGGVQDLPIDKSWSYHSTEPILNQAATNGFWNFLEVVTTPPDVNMNDYAFMSPERVDKVFNRLHPPSSDFRDNENWFKVDRPNILVVFMEGIPANVVGCVEGEKGITPEMDKIAEEGIAFTRFYSTGFRTEQGLCAMVSGFPSQPTTTVIRKYGKFDKLPSFINRLRDVGYRTAYFYGGDVEFANTRSYLSTMGMESIGNQSSFDDTAPRTNWGVLDRVLMDHYLQEGLGSDGPFYHIIMTSTSHEPYDKAPVPDVFNATELPDHFRNTVHYTDACIGELMHGLKKWSGYDSTIVLILSDHGHQLPEWLHNHASERHRIPLIITGGALHDHLRGTVDSTYASHVDLPRTLLTQLGLSSDEFHWSKDMQESGMHHFAFWTFNNGYGMADAEGELIYDHVIQDTLSTTYPSELLHQRREEGDACLQRLMREYKELDS